MTNSDNSTPSTGRNAAARSRRAPANSTPTEPVAPPAPAPVTYAPQPSGPSRTFLIVGAVAVAAVSLIIGGFVGFGIAHAFDSGRNVNASYNSPFGGPGNGHGFDQQGQGGHGHGFGQNGGQNGPGQNGGFPGMPGQNQPGQNQPGQNGGGQNGGGQPDTTLPSPAPSN